MSLCSILIRLKIDHIASYHLIITIPLRYVMYHLIINYSTIAQYFILNTFIQILSVFEYTNFRLSCPK